jgi:uncharacterized protein YjlB
MKNKTDTDPAQAIQHVNIIRHLLIDDGTYPNNGLLPLLVYQKALQVPEVDPEKTIIEIFETNEWVNAWVNGVYDYHHYHSTAHEVLGVIRGSARVQFGGPEGTSILLETGDAVVIPAGVAHKAIDVYDEFTCIGAYPVGQQFNILTGEKSEREKAIEEIKSLGLPLADPIYGTEGPLIINWKK